MSKIKSFSNISENIKLRSSFRDTMYHVLRDKDQTGVFGQTGDIFQIAFAIGYHFNQQIPPGKNSINHVNVISLDLDFKEIASLLILKRKPNIETAKELWKEAESYAEYGIQVLFNSWKENNGKLDIPSILENNLNTT